MVTDSATVTMESLYRNQQTTIALSNGAIAETLTPYDLPFLQNGVPYAPYIREWPYLRHR